MVLGGWGWEWQSLSSVPSWQRSTWNQKKEKEKRGESNLCTCEDGTEDYESHGQQEGAKLVPYI